MAVLALLLIFAASASADEATPRPAAEEVQAYAEVADVSPQTARESLTLQTEEAALPDELQAATGTEYAGLWFDSDRGEFVIPVPSARAEDAVEADLPINAGDYRTQPVTTTWAELEAAQKAFMAAVLPLVPPQTVLSSLDARTNAVAISVSSALQPSLRETVEARGRGLGVPTEVRERDPSALRLGTLSRGPEGCDTVAHTCPRPLRGGTAWGYPAAGAPYVNNECTTGFPVIGNANGNRFMLTAGHCVAAGEEFRAAWAEVPAVEYERHEVGPSAGFELGAGGDWDLYKTNGTFWDQGSAAPRIAVWGENESYSILSEGSSYLGQPMCHSGITTGTSCGLVDGTDVYAEEYLTSPSHTRLVEHLTLAGPVCAEHGDSGGPVFSGHTAFGILSAGTLEKPLCQRDIAYTEITRISEETGTHVASTVGQKPVVKIATGDPNPARNEPPTFSGSTTTLHGTADPNGIAANYHFELGIGGYGQNTAVASAGAGFQPVRVEAAVPGLQGSILYHYRLTAENGAGAVYTEDHQFTTPAFPPAVTNVSAVAGKLSLTLKATIAPLSNATSYRFEYGHTAAYGSSVPIPDGSMLGDNQLHEVSQILGEVEGTYHYRVVAINAGGTTYSPDGEIYVQERPVVTPEAAATHVGGSADLKGAIDPRGVATSYYFEYGKTTSYGSKTGEGSAGQSKGSPVKVSASVSGLEFGTNYHFRLVASNSAGTRTGPDLTFSPGWEMSSMRPASGFADVYEGVSCAGVASCVAVGHEATSETGGSLVATSAIWNGADWEARLMPNPAQTNTIFLPAASCPVGGSVCEAFGYILTTGTEFRAVAERWNGTSWELQSTPNPAGTSSGIFSGGACANASLCFAVGRAIYPTPTLHTGALIERWNGTSWGEATAPTPSGTKESILLSASCPSSSFCAALGGYVNEAGEGGYFVDRWNGTTWTAEVLPKAPGTAAESGYSNISCTSATFCEIVGPYLEAGTPRIFSERWNGSKWELGNFAAPAGAASKDFTVKGLACPTASTCEAVGTYHEVGESKPEIAFAERWNGSKWEQQVLPTSPVVAATRLEAVSCAGETSCMAVGEFNGEGNTKGLGEAHVKTPAPAAVTKAATAIAKTGATLNATINPHEAETKYRFEYGTTTAYGSSTTETSAGAGTAAKEVSAAITGLSAGTRYHVRVKATSAAGTVYGRDLSFETTPEGTAKSLGELPITDMLSNPETHYASWSEIPWANGPGKRGVPTVNGWKTGSTSLSLITGMLWGPLANDSGAGEACIVTLRSYTTVEGESFSIWLDSPTAPTSRTGYQLTFLHAAGANLYKATLSKWSAGAQTVLAEKTNVTITNMTPVALVDQGNAVSAWIGTETGYTQLLSVTDSTFSSGTTLIEGTGEHFWLLYLKFGGLS